jgi:sec-independent protein translocase protein TatA
MGNLGGPEIILILLVVFVFFGAKKIPEIAKGLGEGIREFRKAARDVQSEVEKETAKPDEKNEPKPKV